MPRFTYNTAAGDLTIGGIAMNCPAWKIMNLHILQQPADQRGDDRLIPGTNGVLPLRRRATVTRHGLQLLISGTHDRTGVANVDSFAQLASNIDYLEFYVVRPTGTGDGTRSAVLTMPGGTTRTEPVHVTGMEFGDVSPDGAWMKAILEISIPSGRFT